MTHISVNSWLKRFQEEGIHGLETRPGRGRKPIMDCSDEEAVRAAIEKDKQSVKKAKEAWQKASGKEASESTFKFFIRLGARYRRIRKRPKEKPSPQLYAYESHICTEGYVPYGWQFRGENVFISSAKNTRLNILGMIDRNNRYDGFSTTENITSERPIGHWRR